MGFSVVWNPKVKESSVLLTVEEAHIKLWTLDQTCSQQTKYDILEVNDQGFQAACWDPHYDDQFVSVNNRDIRAWDTRTLKSTQCIADAHEQLITTIDYNPNKPYHIMTGAKDRKIHMWDLRKPTMPLKVLSSHTHWVSNVRYNRFHDQLLLSSGTDCSVNLWSIVSISSAPLGDLEDSEKDIDKLIKKYDDHDDRIWNCMELF